MVRTEERQVGHDHDRGGGAATGEDRERTIDHAGERRRGVVAQGERAVLAGRRRDIVSVGGDEHAVDGCGA